MILGRQKATTDDSVASTADVIFGNCFNFFPASVSSGDEAARNELCKEREKARRQARSSMVQSDEVATRFSVTHVL